MNPASAEQIRSLVRNGVDWSQFLAVARIHGLIPLVYRHLNAICPDSVPTIILQKIREEVGSNAHRCLLLTAELLRVERLFAAHGIHAIPFKGPVLAASVYGNVALRQYSDLDLLVRREDVFRAQELLISNGYRPESPFSARQESALAYLDEHYEASFLRDDGRVLVELHWALAPRYFGVPLAVDECLRRAETIAIAGMGLRNLAPDDLLFVLCVHGSKHRWERIEWICGVAEVIRAHPDIEWTQALKEAAAVGGERMVRVGLLLASELLGAPVPQRLLETIRVDRQAVLLAEQVKISLCRIGSGVISAGERFIFHWRVRERLRDRLRLALYPTASDVAALSLPAPLFFVYYLIRPVRLIGRYFFCLDRLRVVRFLADRHPRPAAP